MTLFHKYSLRILVCITISSVALQLSAQRKITPVEPKGSVSTIGKNAKNPDTKANLQEQLDANGNVVFIDTISGEEWIDTTLVKSTKMIYPLIHAASVGVNIWDPVMRMLGQHYGGADVWAELSMHNRYKPIFVFGMSSCNDAPDGMDYRFKSPLAPYFKIGISYNMLYNSNPDYQLLVGLRYGFTPYKYEITDVTTAPGYWNDPTQFSIPSQNATAGYLEIVAGVRVRIFGNVSLGWLVKYHSLLHNTKGIYGESMYIPGFGKRGTSFTGAFSISYTLPLNKSTSAKVNVDSN